MTNDERHLRQSSAAQVCHCADSPAVITGWVKAMHDLLFRTWPRKRAGGGGAATQEWPIWSVW